MTTLICFGFGYSADHFVRMFGAKFDRIFGTVRDAATRCGAEYEGHEPERRRV